MTLVEGDAWHVDATVRGSRSYDVKLSREHDAIEAWCTCPYCEDYFEPCKHIWATLLAAEAEGYLAGRRQANGAASDVGRPGRRG